MISWCQDRAFYCRPKYYFRTVTDQVAFGFLMSLNRLRISSKVSSIFGRAACAGVTSHALGTTLFNNPAAQNSKAFEGWRKKRKRLQAVDWRDIVAQLVELPPAARRLRMTLAIDAMEAGVAFCPTSPKIVRVTFWDRNHRADPWFATQPGHQRA
jgi:hypothetical protein